MKAIVWLAPFALVGCSVQSAEVKQCEDYLLAKLKAPATYKQVEASSIGIPFDKPKEWSVIIKYDAANTYGTPIRESQICIFPVKDGRPVTGGYINFDDRFAGEASKAADEAEAAAEAAYNEIHGSNR